MKLSFDISPDNDEEIIIKCKSLTEEMRILGEAINGALGQKQRLNVFRDDIDYYIDLSKFLFFESDSSKIIAHTAGNFYFTDMRLYELETLLPRNFIRISKSCIINASAVSAVKKNLTGASTVYFAGTDKVAYASRSYFKNLCQRIGDIKNII